MWREARRLGCCVLLLAAQFPASQAATVIFSDGTFSDSDWVLTLVEEGPGGDAISTQQPSGGNPGDYRRIVTQVDQPGFADRSSVWLFHIRTGATYDPSTQGPLSMIAYIEDSIMFDGFGLGQGTGPALSQSGQLYFAGSLTTGLPAMWVTLTITDVGQDDFVAPNDLTDHPDFSANGDPIAFGFVRINSSPPGGPAYSIDAGIDNWLIITDVSDEVLSLRWSDETTLLWDDNALADEYNIYRGDLRDLSFQYFGDCFDGTFDSFIIELAEPTSGEGFFYLVTLVLPSGAEGTLGHATGMQRTNFNPCP